MSSVLFFKSVSNVISKRSSVCGLRNVYTFFNKLNNKCYHTHRIRLSYPQNLVIHNRMMATAAEIKNIGIEELKQYQEAKNATIIDVREPTEIRETGPLPGGINIPLGNIGQALQEDPDFFEETYHHPKPSFDSPIIFSCRSGKRSLMASEKALSLGYNKVLNFAGGWLEWEKNLPN